MPIINSMYFGSGGPDTSDATATASQILAPHTAYVASGKVTGTIPSQGAQTITPGTTNKTIQSGRYLSGTQTILGDTNLVPGNIREGVSIFGVAGSLYVQNPSIQLSSSQISFDGQRLYIPSNIKAPIWSGTFRYMENVSGSLYLRQLLLYYCMDENYGTVTGYCVLTGRSIDPQDIAIGANGGQAETGVMCIDYLHLQTTLSVDSFYNETMSGFWAIGVQPTD